MPTESQVTETSPVVEREFFQLILEKVKGKGAKYSAVSVVNVIVGQGLILLLHYPLGWGATRSNIVAVLLSAIPAYYLNRIWVWGVRGKSNFKTEILPFWIFVAIGLVMSTVAVTVAARISTNPVVPNLANIAAFGVLWVLRFFILDRLFHQAHLDMYEAAEEIVEIVEHHHHHDHDPRDTSGS